MLALGALGALGTGIALWRAVVLGPALIASAGAYAALLAIDATLDVVAEAAGAKCELIVAYHPVIFEGLKRVVAGQTAFEAVRRGIVNRSPVDGLAPSEIPKQRNQRKIKVLEPATIDTLTRAAVSARWQAAIGLAGYAGLRLGEVRGLTWADVDLHHNTVTVRRQRVPCPCRFAADPRRRGGPLTHDV